MCGPLTRVGFPQSARVAGSYALNLSQEESMRISNVRVFLLSAPIPPERRWTSDFGTNTKQDLAIVIVETEDGLTGDGEAKGTPVVMKVHVEGAARTAAGMRGTRHASSSCGRRCPASHGCRCRWRTGVRITVRAVEGRRTVRSAASTSRSERPTARAWACRFIGCWVVGCASECRPTPAVGGHPLPRQRATLMRHTVPPKTCRYGQRPAD